MSPGKTDIQTNWVDIYEAKIKTYGKGKSATKIASRLRCKLSRKMCPVKTDCHRFMGGFFSFLRSLVVYYELSVQAALVYGAT